MIMKLRIMIWVMVLCLMPICAWAEFDYSVKNYDVSEDDLMIAAEMDFPDWVISSNVASLDKAEISLRSTFVFNN